MYISKAGSKIRSQKNRIIKMHLKENIRILDIAEEYNVTESTIYNYFRDWGVEIIRGKVPYQRRRPEGKHGNNKKYYNKPMKISPELMAQRKINQRVNNKKIHFIAVSGNAWNRSQDGRLIRNITSKAYI